MNDLLLELNHVLVVDLCSERYIESLSDCILFGHCLNIVIIGDRNNLCDDTCVVRRCYLCAVLPVNLVTVVLRRIVRSRNHNSGDTSEFSKCKRKLGCGTKNIADISLDSVSCKAKRSLIRKLGRKSSAVKRNSYTLLASIGTAILLDIVGKTLSSLSYSVLVHSVGARSDNSAKSAGTELKLSIKSVFNFSLVIADSHKLLFGGIVKVRII